ncbi:hypothetical protein LH464_20810, partial [Neorhizobium sp. T786]|uniref:hypothetical protein n=1 Tax=Pseudorhizobium xiangyangii TaxID=2883104 RepID=UPI001D00146F
ILPPQPTKLVKLPSPASYYQAPQTKRRGAFLRFPSVSIWVDAILADLVSKFAHDHDAAIELYLWSWIDAFQGFHRVSLIVSG